jgi:hypothetical protein
MKSHDEEIPKWANLIRPSKKVLIAGKKKELGFLLS